jgi:hypothetical protein
VGQIADEADAGSVERGNGGAQSAADSMAVTQEDSDTEDDETAAYDECVDPDDENCEER